MRKLVLSGLLAVACVVQPARAATSAITGYVLDPGGRALAGVCVSADDAATAASFTTSTDGEGVYTLPVAPGSYVVAFRDCSGRGYASQWWNNSPSIDTAVTVDVADGETLNGIDAQLVVGGLVSGTVYDDLGNTLADICVELDGATDHVWTTTREDGRWSATARAGEYIVKFSDCDRDQHPWQWFDLAPVPEDATRLTVQPSGELAGVNAVLTGNPDPSVTSVRAAVPLAPGHPATVTVELANSHYVASYFTLVVEACPRTLGQCWPLANDDEYLDAGADGTRRYQWSVDNWIGEAVITAHIETPFDSDRTNNRQQTTACIRTPVCAGAGVHL